MKRIKKKEMDLLYDEYTNQSNIFGEEYKIIDYIKYIVGNRYELVRVDYDPLYKKHLVIYYNEKDYFGKNSLWKNYMCIINEDKNKKEAKQKCKEWVRTSIRKHIINHKLKNDRCFICDCNYGIEVHHHKTSFDEWFNKLEYNWDYFREEYRGCKGILTEYIEDQFLSKHIKSVLKGDIILYSLCEKHHKEVHSETINLDENIDPFWN